jgi:hypothetical protein
MKVLKPVTFDASTMLISSNAVETYSAWNNGTSYAINAVVDYQTSYFKSLTHSNLNNIPNIVNSTFWTKLGPDNTHAMFDGQVSTETTRTVSPLTVTVACGIVNSVALIGLTGSSVTITVRDAGASPPVFSRTISLDGTIITNWYMYFFEPFVQLGEVVLTDLPPYLNGQIQMVLSGGGAVSIGELICGTAYTIGAEAVESGASVGIIDYSRKDTNPETGITTFTRRAFSKRMSAQFLVDNSQINGVQRILADIRAVPSVYIGVEDTTYAPLVVYGFYRDFNIDIAYPTKSWCRVEVEGLI